MPQVQNSKPVLAIIVPCYNEEAALNISNEVFVGILKEMIDEKSVSDKSYICYIDDGSSDKTWDMILRAMDDFPCVRGISFSRNYGHQSAMLAGIRECKADAYVTVDADLQEDPRAIKEMVTKFNEGYDVVYGVRSSRKKDSIFKRNASAFFYKIMKFIGSDTIYNSSEMRLISGRVAGYVREYNEKNVYLRGIIPSIGFSFATVSYDRKERAAGETKYPLSKLLAAALDGITTTSSKLLVLIFIFGVFLFAGSLLFLLFSIINVMGGFQYGWHFFLLAFIMGISGIQLFALSILGEYTGKIFKEVKNRPSYIIECNRSGGTEDKGHS